MPYLIVKNRDKILFEGQVDTISSYNKKGLFDVLLDHSNFITILEKNIIVRQGNSNQEIVVDNGLMKVIGNKIYIYVGLK